MPSFPEPTSTETSCFFVHECRSRKLGYAIFRASHVPVFLRFLVIYPPGFVILHRIRSYGEKRKEKRKEGRDKERTAAGGNSSQKGFAKTAQTQSLPRFAAASRFGFIASFH